MYPKVKIASPKLNVKYYSERKYTSSSRKVIQKMFKLVHSEFVFE
jgi:hypothetical protein